MASNDRYINIGMGLDIEDLRTGLSEAKREMALAESEFRARTAGLDSWGSSVQGVTEKLVQMGTEITKKKDIVEAYRKELDRVSDTYGADSKKAQEVLTKLNNAEASLTKSQRYYDDLTKQLDNLKKEGGLAAESVDNLRKSIHDLEKHIDDQKKAIADTAQKLEEAKKKYGESSEEAGKLKEALDEQCKSLGLLEDALGDYKDALEDVGKETDDEEKKAGTLQKAFDDLKDKASGAVKNGLDKLKDGFVNLAKKGISMAVSALKDFIKQTIQVGMDFTSTMSEVQAITGATGDDLKMLKDTAREYGETTVFSATESAEALKYMALAGWDAKQSTEALGGMLDLAAASGMDLAAASDMVTDYLTAFGMEASESGKLADMLAYAQSKANTSVAQLSEAYAQSAATLAANGQSVETVTALLAKMADAGVKGSKAGTALGAVMRDITNKMDGGAIKIGEASVKVQDAKGNFRSLTAILGDVAKATDGLGTAERAAALSDVFTTNSLTAINAVFKSGIKSVQNFERGLKKSDGTARQMAETMNDNLSGDVKSMESAIEGLQLRLFDLLEGPMRSIVQFITDAIPVLIEWGEKIYDFFVGIYDATKPLWDALGAFFGEIYQKIKEFVDNVKAIIDAAKGAWDGIKNAFSGADGWFRDLSARMQSMLKAGWDTLAGWFGNIWSGIKGAFNGSDSWFGNLSSKMQSMLKAGWDAVAGWFGGIWNGIKNAFNGAGEWFGDLSARTRNLFKAGWDTLGKFFSDVWEAIKKPFEPVISFFRGLFGNSDGTGGAVAAIKAPFSAIGKFFSDVWEAIKKPFEPVIGFFSNLFGGRTDGQGADERTAGAVGAIKGPFGALEGFFKKVVGFVEDPFGSIQTFFSNTFGSAYSELTGAFSGVSGFFSGMGSNIIAKLLDLPSAFNTLFGRVYNSIIGPLAGVWKWFEDNVLNPLRQGVEAAIEEASNLGGGLIEGATTKRDLVAGTTTIGEVITNSLMDYFGIHSPSTLMRDLIGRNIAAGIAEGMTDATGLAEGAAERLSAGLTGAFGLSAGASGGLVGQTVVFNQTINSPSPMTAGEIYRDTKSLIGRRMTS